MNRGKIIIAGIIVAVAIGLVYLILSMISSQSKSTQYTFIILNNQINENYIDKVVSESVGNLEGQGKDISIKIHPSPGKVVEFILYAPEIFAKETNNDKILKDTLLHLSRIDSIFELDDARIQLETMINYITNPNGGGFNKIYLIGSFPNCFSSHEADTINSIMNKKFANMSNVDYEINWIVKSNEKEPEQHVLNNMQENNIIVKDLQISSASRVCSELQFKDIYTIFFKKLSNDQLTNLFKKLQEDYRNDLRLTIWNSGNLNNKVVELKGDSLDNFRPLFAELEDGRWTSIGFLLNQAVISLKQLPDSVEKELIIIGNSPNESKGSQLHPKVWELYSLIKKLKIKFYLPQNSKETLTDRALINGMKQYGIEIQKVSF